MQCKLKNEVQTKEYKKEYLNLLHGANLQPSFLFAVIRRSYVFWHTWGVVCLLVVWPKLIAFMRIMYACIYFICAAAVSRQTTFLQKPSSSHASWNCWYMCRSFSLIKKSLTNCCSPVGKDMVFQAQDAYFTRGILYHYWYAILQLVQRGGHWKMCL